MMDDGRVVPKSMRETSTQKRNAEKTIKVKRMRAREDRKTWLIYPEDEWKANWDLFITVVLIYTCIVTPHNIAFKDENTMGMTIAMYVIDILFLIDILIAFNSVLLDEDFKTIDNRKQLACNYINGWFFLDVFAIFPFTEIFMLVGSNQASDTENLNQMIRLAKIGRLYKLIKLTKLLRILKIVKEKSKLVKMIRSVIQVGYGFERLFFFVLIFLLIGHIVSCLWIFIAKFKNYEGTWMEDGAAEMTDYNQYLTAFYFTVQTITTVGYGDTSIVSKAERIFVMFIMLFGVVSFSILSGSLTSIIQNYDVSNAAF